VPLDDLAADGQTDAGAGVFLTGVEPLEHLKDPFEVLALDANSVVLDGKDPAIFHGGSGNVDFRIRWLRYLMALPIRFWKSWVS